MHLYRSLPPHRLILANTVIKPSDWRHLVWLHQLLERLPRRLLLCRMGILKRPELWLLQPGWLLWRQLPFHLGVHMMLLHLVFCPNLVLFVGLCLYYRLLHPRSPFATHHHWLYPDHHAKLYHAAYRLLMLQLLCKIMLPFFVDYLT